MSDTHKAALAQGRAEGPGGPRVPGRLRANKPKRGRKRTPDSVKPTPRGDRRGARGGRRTRRAPARPGAPRPAAELETMGDGVDLGRARAGVRRRRRQLQQPSGHLVRVVARGGRPGVRAQAGGHLPQRLSRRVRRRRRRRTSGGRLEVRPRGRPARRASGRRGGASGEVEGLVERSPATGSTSGSASSSARKSAPCLPRPAWRCAARSGRRHRACGPAATRASSTGWLNTRPWLDHRLSSIRSASTCSPPSSRVQPVQHVVDEHRRVGQHDPLDGGMGDVALVPERDILATRPAGWSARPGPGR